MRRELLFILMICLILCSSIAMADGGYVPKRAPDGDTQDLTEPVQRAVIAHFDGRECMTLQVSFRGSASEFVWLIPTPARPAVRRGESRTFNTVYYATGSMIKYWLDADSLVMASDFMVRASSHSPKLAVDVLERKVVGDYDTTVLRAENAADLLDWLDSNGYRVTKKMEPVLADYVRRGWVFTAARINAGSLKSKSELKEGMLDPLQLQFASKRPVYPLRISSINPGPTKATLYVLTDHFVAAAPFRTVCAVKGDSPRCGHYVRALGYQQSYHMHSESGLLKDRSKYHLTKLTADLTPQQMNKDILLLPARPQRETLPEPVSPSLLENIGALVTAPLSWMFAYPLCLIPCSCCFIMAISRTCYADSRTWFCAFFVFLVGWFPATLIISCLVEHGFWPVGLLSILGMLILAIRCLCRWLRAGNWLRRRKKAIVAAVGQGGDELE